MKNKKKWAFLISRWGRSAFHALNAYEKDLLLYSQIDLLLYENLPSGAVDKAMELKIPTLYFPKEKNESKDQYQHRICVELKNREIEYVFLLGFEHIIRSELLNAFKDKIINIHPSLLPSFKGTNAIYQALDYGVKVSGVTTHIIDEKIDEGKILFQEIVKINKEDNFDSLDPRFVEIGKSIVIKTMNNFK